MTLDEIWDRVEFTPTCWLWHGKKNGPGYGVLRFGRTYMAHRFMYELLVGPIPTGLSLDHLCRVVNCVRPEHLEPVTHAENCRRGTLGPVSRARAAAQTHCRNGHPRSPDNVRWYRTRKGHNARQCIECAREAVRRHRLRQKAGNQ